MKRSDLRRCVWALVEKNKVLVILWLLYWVIALPMLLRATSFGNAFPQLIVLFLLTAVLWADFSVPCYDLLIKRSLIERTVHVNYARTYVSKHGRWTEVKTSEIRQGLSYHRPIPDDLIVNKRLTIAYLPRSCIILYVENPLD